MFENLNVTNKFSEMIESDINHNRIPHAIILEGGDAELRLQVAKEIAKAILCMSDIKPCDTCNSCYKVDNNSHPDLHIIAKEEKSNMLKVDDIRNVKQKALLMPNDGDKTVFIISEAQYMNPQAQNALLKIFEEPEPHVNFILTAPSKSAFLETIISRGTAYSLGNSSEEKSVEDEETIHITNAILNGLITSNEYDIMTAIASVKKDKEQFIKVCNHLNHLFCISLVSKYGVNINYKTDNQAYLSFYKLKSTDEILSYIEHITNIIARYYSNANFNILITEFVCGFYKKG